ncbi:MAG TPA: DUF4902 domain-containing protein [Steroidobacteraceae bacterium]|nr:DUF4902 domain-containing protein [Steroidobacteraceae bacterium]
MPSIAAPERYDSKASFDEKLVNVSLSIPVSALDRIALRHLFSKLDPTIAVVDGVQDPGMTSGITEWIGECGDAIISIGWDWGVTMGVIVTLNPAEIRTNVQLLNADGGRLPTDIGRAHLLHWVEATPWRQVICNLLQNDAL